MSWSTFPFVLTSESLIYAYRYTGGSSPGNTSACLSCSLSQRSPLCVWEKKIITCPSSTSQSTDLGIESREWEWICFCNWTAVFLFHLLQMCCTVYIPIHFKVLMAKLHWTCFGNGPFLMHLNTSVSQMPTLFVSSVRVTFCSPLLYVSFHFSCTSSLLLHLIILLWSERKDLEWKLVSLLSVDFSKWPLIHSAAMDSNVT